MSSTVDANAVVDPPLPQAVGYVVVVVIGLIIAFSASNKPFNHHFQPFNLPCSHDICYSTAEADLWGGQQED